MKIFQPIWVNHDDKPIFSLDIHPDGSRMATGGQGNDCGRVAIWNMAPIKSEKDEKDSAIPKMLCQMDNHLGCVNCVRWSLNGQMLASGGDDKIIMIWRRSKGTGSSFGGFAKNHENWRCVHTLRGHEGDVLDLAWSPGDRWLASSSVDNSVFVWDISSGPTPTVMSILKGHTGLVKGVAWDPVGKYVASQSDDRSVKIWKTADWTCDSTITDPFVECGGTTHVLRLSWSPDGQYLVSAHAMNGGGPTAQIIDREGWKCDKDFVGHRKAVTCVRFHGSIMMRTAPKTSKTQQYCCLAVGSRDKSVSIWMTALQRPLVVIYDVFQDSVLDMSWSTDGYILMACSGDGTVVFIQFNEQDLGTPLSELEKNALYQRMYGKSVNDMNVSTDKDVIIENAELLNPSAVEKNSLNSSLGGKPIPSFLSPAELKVTSENYPKITSRMDERCEASSSFACSPAVATSTPPGATASPAKQAIHKQIETRTKDGKRRITPMFIPLSQDVDMEERPSTGGEIQSSSVISTSSIVIEKQLQSPDRLLMARTDEERNRMDSRLAKVQQDTAPAKTDSTLISEATATNASSASAAQQKSNAANNARSLFLPTHRPEAFNAGVTRIVANSRILVQNHFQKISPATPSSIHRVACYDNLTATASKLPLHQQKPLWQCITGSPICNFNSCAKYIGIGCTDGSVRFLDLRSGGLVLPVVTLASSVVQSAFCLTDEGDGGKHLAGIVTETGVLRIWDLKRRRIELAVTCQDLLRSVSTQQVTTGSGGGGVGSSGGGGGGGGSGGQSAGGSTTIVMLSITENGAAFIVLGNGTSYCYDRELDSWLVLSGKDLLQQRALIRCAPTQMLNPNTIISKDMKRYPLTSIQTTVLGMISSSAIHAATAQGGPTGTGASEWESTAQLAFIENQIKLCEAIRSAEELKYWYSSLGYSLALGVGTEVRLRLLLDDLLGPIYASAETHNKREILGIRKLDILELVLGHIKGQAKWQRIAMEYSDQVQELKRNIAAK